MIRGKRKGEFGYRSSHRRRQLLLVALFLLAIAVQLFARRFAGDSMKNVLTVSAILTVLPMANLASPLLAALRIPSGSDALHEACLPCEKKFPILYDLILTSKEMMIPADAVAIHPSGVYLYCPKRDINAKKAESYLNEMLRKWKLDGNAKVITEERTFLKRLNSLKPVTEDEDDGSAPHVAELLRNLSM